MNKYGVVEYSRENRVDLYKVKVSSSFTWGDGTEINRCEILYLVESSTSYMKDLSFKPSEELSLYKKAIHEFESDEEAKLWFKLNY